MSETSWQPFGTRHVTDKSATPKKFVSQPHQTRITPPRDPAVSLARLFDLASRYLHTAGFAGGLYPAQWTTLRYLADAPELSRTAAHIARFQQIAIGPVSRTVRTLIAKGLVAKAGQGAHHRSELLALTRDGVKVLECDPLQPVIAILRSLPQGEDEKLAELLLKIIASLNSASETETMFIMRTREISNI